MLRNLAVQAEGEAAKQAGERTHGCACDAHDPDSHERRREMRGLIDDLFAHGYTPMEKIWQAYAVDSALTTVQELVPTLLM